MNENQRINIDRWEVQLRKGSLDLAVLASLWNGPGYGLEILRNLERTASLIVPEGTIYPLLSRLKIEGYVSSKWAEAEGGHPRKYYALTGRGRKHVREMDILWNLFSGSLDELLTAVRKDRP